MELQHLKYSYFYEKVQANDYKTKQLRTCLREKN